jgi:hypothetical protein
MAGFDGDSAQSVAQDPTCRQKPLELNFSVLGGRCAAALLVPGTAPDLNPYDLT